ncbi:hypothetical protein Rhe02_68490 [Rhizocola hellebori]|uniref:Uncharacterized protein n=1 Tax=Rhizocola hellebori TaxID=1392758 RepID=A0A8J3QFQ6_9ACTN|nr:hypothetical protein [Rhizocola hellebori]GIH08782.1 hypothetical protein Rhe02_68490 [Rhizocola hellebori]
MLPWHLLPGVRLAVLTGGGTTVLPGHRLARRVSCDGLAGGVLPGHRLVLSRVRLTRSTGRTWPAVRGGVLPAHGLQAGGGRIVQAGHRLARSVWAGLRTGGAAVNVATRRGLGRASGRDRALRAGAARLARLAVLLRRARRTPVRRTGRHGTRRHRLPRLAGWALRRSTVLAGRTLLRATTLAGRALRRAGTVRAGLLLRRVGRAALLTGLARVLLRPATWRHRRARALLRRPWLLALALLRRRRRRAGPYRAGRLLVTLTRHRGAWCGRSFRPRRCAPMTLLGTLVRHWCLTCPVNSCPVASATG